MRKLILKLTLICIILLSISLVVKAQSMNPHFYKIFYALSSITPTNMVFINLAVIMMILLLFSTLIFKNTIKLKAKTEEMNNLHELRKTFIDSDKRLNKRKEEKTLLRNSILVNVFIHKFRCTHDQLDYVLTKALELTESKSGYICLYDEGSQEVTLNTWSEDVMDEGETEHKKRKYQLKDTGLWGESLRQKRPIVVNDLEMPNLMKNGYPHSDVELCKFMSVPVIINDKIVAVVGLANKEEDYDDTDVYQLTVLMTGVWNDIERRKGEIELEKTNIILKDSKDKLQLILDSTAEAIYGIDNNGNCTFCNASCLKILGYNNCQQLIGKNMHLLIHHSHEDGTALHIDDCLVFKGFRLGEGVHVDDEVFWKADGTSFNVEYFSYPQYRGEEIIGAVVTFLDITDRRKSERDIKYLSYHDPLTSLYNRLFFEEELKRLDTEANLPISIIVGDVNSLKLTNDIFGHDAGDVLLQKVAEVFKKNCRVKDIISRVGGDEFTILLPQTKIEDAEEIILRIKNQFSKEHIEAIKCSISMGCHTKVYVEQSIMKTMQKAEDKMYSEKTLNRKIINSNIIKTIIQTLYRKSKYEEEHSKMVSVISQNIGMAMNLSDEEIRKLKEAGSLHDIGKIILDDNILKNHGILSAKESKKIKEHPIIGYGILNYFDETLDIAECVLAHHEAWDGSGYPKGSKGEEIPKLARVISIAESYNAMTSRMINKNIFSKEEAILELQKYAGSKFDPNIVEIFIKKVLSIMNSR